MLQLSLTIYININREQRQSRARESSEWDLFLSFCFHRIRGPSFNRSSIGMRPGSQTQLKHVLCNVVSFLNDGEIRRRLSFPDGVFLCRDHGLNFDIILYEKSNQSIKMPCGCLLNSSLSPSPSPSTRSALLSRGASRNTALYLTVKISKWYDNS